MSEIEHFLEITDNEYSIAIDELKNGKKQTHWIWYIFPQHEKLGQSAKAKYYGLQNLDHAKKYLENELLANRLKIACETILLHKGKQIEEILPFPDNLKLQSSMAIFVMAMEENTECNVFCEVLKSFYNGEFCKRTMEILLAESK